MATIQLFQFFSRRHSSCSMVSNAAASDSKAITKDSLGMPACNMLTFTVLETSLIFRLKILIKTTPEL